MSIPSRTAARAFGLPAGGAGARNGRVNGNDGTLLICRVGPRYLGLRLEIVARVERAVEIAPWPEAPAGVSGVINVHGEPVPVLDPRPALGLEARPRPEPSDQLVLLRIDAPGGTRSGALLVDETLGLAPPSAQSKAQPARELVAGLGEEDQVVIVGEHLVIVRGDGVLIPPALTDAAASLKIGP